MIRLFFLLFFIIFNVDARRYALPWGVHEIRDPKIQQLISAPVMQRLHYIDQHGLIYYVFGFPPFTRFDHCVGVFALLERYGAPQKEQVAGLLHDASHTVFSHTGDMVFDAQHKQKSYQDDIHIWFLGEMGAAKPLERLGYSIHEMDPDMPGFQRLEQNLPDMCADRIQYNLHTAYIFDKLTRADVNEILDDLHFDDGKWYFTNRDSAYQFAQWPMFFTENFWASAINEVLNFWGGEMLKRALEIDLITTDDIHFGYDLAVLKKLETSDDSQIKKLWHKIYHPHGYFEQVFDDSYTYISHPKFRGIDPWVKKGNKWARLSELNPSFKAEFDRIKSQLKEGLRIKFKDPKSKA